MSLPFDKLGLPEPAMHSRPTIPDLRLNLDHKLLQAVHLLPGDTGRC